MIDLFLDLIICSTFLFAAAITLRDTELGIQLETRTQQPLRQLMTIILYGFAAFGAYCLCQQSDDLLGLTGTKSSI